MLRARLVQICCVLLGAIIYSSAFALDLEAIDTKAQSIVKSGDVVGLAIAVVKDGEVALLNTYGARAINAPDPVTPETRFRIASLSKGFTGAVAAQLAHEGKISLDAPIAAYAPEFRLKSAAARNKVTLANVLSHRVGLPPYAYDNLLEAGVTPKNILQRYSDVDLICPVGACYAYQNVSFNMAAAAIEKIENAPFAESIETRLFKPLAMNSASYGQAALKTDNNWARPHRRRRGEAWRVVDVREPYYAIPAAGGVNASIADMAKWLKAQLGAAPNVLPADVLTLAHRPLVSTPAEIGRNRQMTRLTKADYGLGWRIYQYGGETVINHSGSVEGYSAQIAFLPNRDIGVVFLTNSRSKAYWGMLPAFLDLALQEESLD